MPTDGEVTATADTLSPQMARAIRNRGLRLVLAPAAVLALGATFDWPVFYVGAVLAALLTQAPRPMPLRAGIRLIGAAALLAGAFLLAMWLSPYQVVFVAGIALAIGLAFRAAIKGASMLFTLLALVAALLVPFLVKISEALAGVICVRLVLNIAIALLASWVAFALFPAVRSAEEALAVSAGPAFDPDRRLTRMCLVSIPFVMAFFIFEASAPLVLIFVAVLTTQLTESSKAAPAVARGMMRPISWAVRRQFWFSRPL